MPPATVFLGTGAFALPVLAALAEAPEVDLRAVVTAPARPAGRHLQPTPSPVGAFAAERGLALLTPARLREPGAIEALRAMAPELIVLADYGQLVPEAILGLPRHGALNLHPSLLPRHRGASPIPAAILAGDAKTGVSLMRMEAALDSGPLLAQVSTPIGAEETAPELEARLAVLAARLLGDSLGPWLAGALPAVAQSVAGVTMTRPLRREDGRLDPTKPAVLLARQVRALQPWPGTFAETVAGRLVVWRAAARSVETVPGARAARPGTLLGDLDGLALRTGEGILRLDEVQPAGGRRMSAAELRRGRPGLLGSLVGPATVG